MSKIDDMLRDLHNFLTGNDHSDTAQTRKLFALYADSCSAVARQLAECKELISRGLLLDALKLSSDMTPRLSERAAKLTLPPELRREYEQICQLYGYPAAQEFDRKLLEQLQNPQQGSRLNSLILRWRKIARSRNNRDKINLLREIIACSPENDQIWRNNLHSVEQIYLSELYAEAENALKENDSRQLLKLYMALTDPLLQTHLPAGKLERFAAPVRRQQELELQQQLEEKRTALFSAYSAMDAGLIAQLLQEYDILITHPLYQSDANAENAVNEVRSYLEQHTEARRKETEFIRKKAELVAALEEHADYPVIENIFESLRQLDLPLEAMLCQRIANRRSEYLAENSRRHWRKCIYGILGAVLLLAALFLLFNAIEHTRSYFNCQDAMQKLLQSGNYAGVIKLHDNIAQKSPLLLRFGNLTALTLEARKKLEQLQEQQQKIDDLLKLAEQELAASTPQLSELVRLQQQLEPLTSAQELPARLADRWQRFNIALRQQNSYHQSRIDRQFTSDLDKVIVQMQKFEHPQFTTSVEYTQAVQQLERLIQQGELICREAANATSSLREGRHKLLQMRSSSLRRKLQDHHRRISLLHDLQKPTSFIKYTAALSSLPEKAPDLAGGKWRSALQKLPAALASSAVFEAAYSLSNHKDLEQFLSNQESFLQKHPAIGDALKILPDKYFKDKLEQQIKLLDRELKTAFDCYELIFVDQDGSRWYFYAAEKPIMDKSQTSRLPKAIALNVILAPGTEGKFLPLKIARSHSGAPYFYPGKLEGVALPSAFIKLENVKLERGKLPKAIHCKFLLDALHELNLADTPERLEAIIFQQLAKLKNADSMNTVARAVLTRKLLDFLPAVSPLYTEKVNYYSVELDNMAMNFYDRWQQPTLEIEYPQLTGKIREFFRNFQPLQMQQFKKLTVKLYQQALNRSLTPGGIIMQDQNQKVYLHNFAAMDNIEEIWIFTPSSRSGRQGWIVEDRNSVLQRKDLGHGTVYFVPLDNLKTAQLAEQFKQEFQQTNTATPPWPESWPLNMR